MHPKAASTAAAAAVAAAAALCGVALALARRRRNGRRPTRLIFYDRVSSNNAARIRLWAHLCGEHSILESRRPVAHAEQRTKAYRAVTPFLKVPAMELHYADGERACLAEAAVILEYLEHDRAARRWPWAPRRPGPLLPEAPEARAHMNLVIRCHDLYLASPNCTQPGPFTHTQGCFYVGPPGGAHAADRWIGRAERAAKLAECWRMLDVLETLLSRGPYFAGGALSLADLAVYPTLVFFSFYPQRAFGWAEGALWHGRPRLRHWYEQTMAGLPAARTVRAELLPTLHAKAASGVLEEIAAEARDPAYKWVYP